jgi:hypothetical protein
MNRNEILRNVGLAAMFFGGFLGAQSIWWGWITAILGMGLMLLVLWLQHRSDKEKDGSGQD